MACKSLPPPLSARPGVTLHRWDQAHGQESHDMVCEVAIISGIIPALSPDNSSLGHRLTYSAVIIRNNLAAPITAISMVPTNIGHLVCLISDHDQIFWGF